jgi:hypothetical protein
VIDPLKFQAEVQALLPYGFTCHGACIETHRDGTEEWFTMQFSYCDRTKYISARVQEENGDDLLASDVAGHIEITPMIEMHEAHPDQVQTIYRCLRKNPTYAEHQVEL